MSKIIVVNTAQTNHVLAAVTRNVNPDDEIDSADFLSNGFTVRGKAPLNTLALPFDAADSNLIHHATMTLPEDQLGANLVDGGLNVLRDPRNFYLKIPEEGPAELAVIQSDQLLHVDKLLSNGNLKVKIPQDAFGQEPKITIWGRVNGAGSEANATPVTAEPSTPAADVEVTLNFGPVQVSAVYTIMVFAVSLGPVIKKQTIT